MAYTNKVPSATAVATSVLFLMLMIAPRCTEAQQLPKVNPICALLDIPNTVQLCYLSGNLVPSEECCKDLNSANTAKVTCLCDNIIANPSNANFTRVLFDAVHTACGVLDKFACKGGGSNGGATNKIAASMGLFGLVASFFF